MATDDWGAGPGGQPPSYASEHGAVSASLWQVRSDWISFFDAQYRPVVGFVMKNGARLEEAEDAAHEAFVESWRLMLAEPGRWAAITNMAAWIRTVALRKYQRPPGPRVRLRIDAAAELPDLPTPGPGPEELAAETQLVVEALRSLDETARKIITFRMDGFTTPAIADALDITEQRVRDIEKRARKNLKQHLSKNTEGSEQR